MKFVVCVAAASLCLISVPAVAQDLLVACMLTEVCRPYAARARSFEKAIKAARDLGFRRPVDDIQPLDEGAAEIDLVSDDGNWRLRIEEGTLEQGDARVYAASCAIPSRRASAREPADPGRRAFGDPERWTTWPDHHPRRRERRTRRPAEDRLAVEVAEPAERRPTMTVTGHYFQAAAFAASRIRPTIAFRPLARWRVRADGRPRRSRAARASKPRISSGRRSE